jgi:hypothetical protein
MIERKIYSIRGQNIMLDRDLATLYGVQTFRLNEAAKRNRARFPEDFMFRLTITETRALTSQIAMSNHGRGGRRTLPYAFTEQGVAMLSSVLRSERAVQVNVAIMRTFVMLRRLVATNKELAQKLEEMEKKYDSRFQVVFRAIRELMEPKPVPPTRQIGFRVRE